MEVDKKRVGQRIKAIRQSKGMTLEEFGNLFGATKGNVSLWEKGSSIPSNERLRLIAAKEGISVNELLYGDERDYFFSVLPTNDLELMDLAYDFYVRRFGKDTYQDKNTIIEFFEESKTYLEAANKEVNTRVNQINKISNLLVSKFLIDHILEKNSIKTLGLEQSVLLSHIDYHTTDSIERHFNTIAFDSDLKVVKSNLIRDLGFLIDEGKTNTHTLESFFEKYADNFRFKD